LGGLLALLLAEGPRSVRELTELSGMSQTLVSHNLASLREQGLVTITPKGADACCSG
jgi:DNA-binding transcriptional ArsR family regulator